MNISKNTHKPIYVCDKCNKRIDYTYRRGRKVYKYYSYDQKTYGPKKNFAYMLTVRRKYQERKYLTL